MGMRPTLDYYGGNFAGVIDKLLGDAFAKVQRVADQMDGIQTIIDNLPALLTIAAQYTKYNNLLATQLISAPLNVTATNTLAALAIPYIGSGGYAVLFVNGQAYPLTNTNPAFTIVGTTVLWNATNASGVTLTPGSTQVFITYAPAPSGS